MRKASTLEVVDDFEGTEVVLESVSWQTYEAILRGMGRRHLRVTYDEGELEITTLSFEHENRGGLLGRMVEVLTMILEINIASGGMTTLRKKLRKKGLEPDRSYWIQNERRMRGRKRWLADRDPPPDLAIEIDISHSSLNRMGIYAVLGVPEIWSYDGEALTIYHLEPERKKYQARSHSRAFPFLLTSELQGFMDDADAQDETVWIRRFADWVKTELQPRYVVRKNGETRRT